MIIIQSFIVFYVDYVHSNLRENFDSDKIIIVHHWIEEYSIAGCNVAVDNR